VAAARSEAQRLVQRTEIVKDAQVQARRLVDAARDEARRLRLEAEDYADQKLAQFEIVLERTLRTVVSGRTKLAAPVTGAREEPADKTSRGQAGLFAGDQAASPGDTSRFGEALFDQDTSD
jgi:cell division septum initiation protein DivIVA